MESNIKDIRNLCEQNTEMVETENVETAEVTNEVEETEEDTKETETPTAQEPEKPKVEPLPEQKPFLYSPYERAILEEMERRSVDNSALAEGLKDKDKSIGECVSFVKNRAQKLATDQCAIVEDNVVYAWAQFYYTQRREIINLELKPKPTYTPPTPKPKADTKAGDKAKKDTKKEPKKDEKKETPKADNKEQKPVSKDNVTEVKGADGKTHTITEFGLF